jgi:hypothetical protein
MRSQKVLIIRQACLTTLAANAITKGNVTLVNADADIRAAALGIFATQ